MNLLLRLIVAVVVGGLAAWVLGLVPFVPDWLATLLGFAVGVAVFAQDENLLTRR